MGELSDCLYLSHVLLPIGDRMMAQWSASNSIASSNWINTPRWPSPFWDSSSFLMNMVNVLTSFVVEPKFGT